MAAEAFRVELGGWEAMRAEAEPIRFEVFVNEQQVPPESELDEWDATSLHALAFDAAGSAVATGRLLPDGHIGRMAVLREARGQGAGAAVLAALMAAARQRGAHEVVLSAQTHALAFYERAGFVAEGPEYLDCDIPHRLMRRALS
ncbi:MAG TPA: GNAT family N-acetyltransferase [Burkholderiaceae bacterium]|nr:GNAT family N-acetyltransferase [Burkholderiaceae bacterium]HPE00839.1 GNAT family N-acetyltransferase [Burkholderiaceae bacterium]HRZ01026.1 GNAT family N-acetyltransferase [Burkholderiaceae bacterium]